MRYVIVVGILTILISSNMIISQSIQINPQEPYTICYLLHNMNSYTGKVIRVRGEWRAQSLWDECPIQFQTEDHKWPNAIYLVVKEMLHTTDKPVDWAFGINDFSQLLFQTLHYKLPVYATFEGRLDTRAVLLKYPNNDRQAPGGYGHLGYYPAQLVVRQISDITGSGLLEHPREIEKGSIED